MDCLSDFGRVTQHVEPGGLGRQLNGQGVSLRLTLSMRTWVQDPKSSVVASTCNPVAEEVKTNGCPGITGRGGNPNTQKWTAPLE